MWVVIARALVAAAVVALVPMLADRYPRLGALIMTLPVVSLLVFIFTWAVHRDLDTIARLSRETLVLVPLGLPFFVPLALADRLGLNFWVAFIIGVALAAACIGLWFRYGPQLG